MDWMNNKSSLSIFTDEICFLQFSELAIYYLKIINVSTLK